MKKRLGVRQASRRVGFVARSGRAPSARGRPRGHLV